VQKKLRAGAHGQAEPAQTQTSPAPLPEAPASVNVHLTVGGRQVQLTLRDSDESRLLARLDAILERFPVADKPARHHAAVPPAWGHEAEHQG
jgi:hypothetical protein